MTAGELLVAQNVVLGRSSVIAAIDASEQSASAPGNNGLVSVSVTMDGSGSAYAVSQNSDIATATYNRATNSIDVTPYSAGTAKISVYAGADDKYAASAPVELTVVVVETSFRGGSLRVDNPSTTSASIRLGYQIVMPEELFESGSVAWQWSYGASTAVDAGTLAGKNLIVESRDEEAGTVTIVSNIVFTNVAKASFDSTLYARLEVVSVDGSSDQAQAISAGAVYGRSVLDVARAILADDSATDDARDYASGLIGE
jgi:hypothetical protein